MRSERRKPGCRDPVRGPRNGRHRGQSNRGRQIKPLAVIPDDRGRLMEILRCDDELFSRFGQVYMTTTYPDVVKAWHMHRAADRPHVRRARHVPPGPLRCSRRSRPPGEPSRRSTWVCTRRFWCASPRASTTAGCACRSRRAWWSTSPTSPTTASEPGRVPAAAGHARDPLRLGQERRVIEPDVQPARPAAKERTTLRPRDCW